MSKFLSNLRMVRLERSRIALPTCLTSINVTEERSALYPTATLYRVGVEVGANVMIEDSVSSDIAKKHQVKYVKRAIAHEIYEDVRAGLLEMYPQLLRLKRAAWRDAEAFAAVQALEERVQGVLDAITPS